MSTDPRIEAAAIALNREGWTCQEGSDEPGSYGTCEDCTRDCDKLAAAALAAADKAATISTTEELDALPIESVILDCEGYPYRRVRQYPDVPSSWEGYELGEHLDVDTIDFPARVIHFGGQS